MNAHHGRSDFSSHRSLPAPPSRSYYREKPKTFSEAKGSGSSASKAPPEVPVRGFLQENNHDSLPQEALNEAMGEVRDVMLQYTMCTEREARKERVRQAEERGQMKKQQFTWLEPLLPHPVRTK